MKNVIIGTAGHVDHGKTALIKALTGIDTDRLAEEKKRGITIELGFAHLDFDDGTRAGIVDVPGHEKFIRNMLAGAGGIDLAMLVVAADEGVMPQTIEHMAILSLLGIKNGLVAVTKTDIVDDELLELVLDDINEFVADTFLDGKPIIPVSAYTGEGLAEIKSCLHSMAGEISQKNAKIPFRLPVDRVFPVDGFGTVVTGTLIEGVVTTGDHADILPSGIPAVIKNVQVHGEKVSSASAGQRVALNLSGIKRTDIDRGDVIAAHGSVKTSTMLDVRLDVLKNARHPIKNASLLHLYHGSRVLIAKVILLDSDELLPGNSCYAQFRLTEALPSKIGDRFVVRFYSPLETIGGGIILDSYPLKHKRYDPKVCESLVIRETGSIGERICQAASKIGSVSTASELRTELGMNEPDFTAELEALISSGRIMELLPGRYMADSTFEKFSTNCQTLLSDYHKLHPLHAGQRLAELRQKLFGKSEASIGNAVINELCREGRLSLKEGRVSLYDFEVRLTKRQKSIRDKIIKTYKDAAFDTPSSEELFAMFAAGEKNDCSDVFESLLSDGSIIMLSPKIFWHKDSFACALKSVRDYFEHNIELSMPQLRDMLSTSRKYAIAFLEYLDGKTVTKKVGDLRVVFKGYSMLD